MNSLKDKYCGSSRGGVSLRSDRQKGDYLSTLLLMEESDFFFQLYKTVETNRLILTSHLDDIYIKERFDMVNYRDRLLKDHRAWNSRT